MFKILIFLSSLLSLYGLYMGISESIYGFNLAEMLQIWLGLSSPLVILLLYKLIFKKK